MDEQRQFEELERAYDLLAGEIDAVGTEHEALFLCKLALTLAEELGSFERFSMAVKTARQDLAPTSSQS
jgi:hypothetical protein